MSWHAQVNDLVGGWIVTKLDAPLSEHKDVQYPCVIAECITELDAARIANLLNIEEQHIEAEGDDE